MGIYRKLSVKALAFGSLVDIAGSAIVGLIIGIAIGVYYGVMGVPENEIQAQLQGPIVLIPGLLIGAGFTALGGYIAGRTASVHEVLHGGFVGGISLLFGSLFWSEFPVWYSVTGLLIAIPLGMLGGHFAASSSGEATVVQ